MEMQISNGVLHGVLNGEVHEECCTGCMLWWMEKWCRGCQHKMGCLDARLGAGYVPTLKSGARWNSGQDGSKGVLDAVLRSVSYFRLQFIRLEHLYTAKLV